MNATAKQSWPARIKLFLLHRLFLLDHERIRNAHLLLFADVMEIASFMFYLMGSALGLPGPIYQLYAEVPVTAMQFVQPVMVLGWSSAGNASYVPVGVAALNTAVLLTVLLATGRLNSIAFKIVEAYLLFVPVLFIDEVLAVLDVPQPGIKIDSCESCLAAAAGVGSLATCIVLLFALFLRRKLHRVFEVVVVVGVRFQLNKWALLALLVVRIFVEGVALRKSTMRTDVQLLAGAFLTLTSAVAMISGQSTYCNDTLTFVGLALTVAAALLHTSKNRSNWYGVIGVLAEIEDKQKLLEHLEDHIQQCRNKLCPCRSADSTAIAPEQLKRLMVDIALAIHDDISAKTNNDHIEFAQFCLEHHNSNLKGLSSICQAVRPADIFEEYRRLSVCLRYEIEARSTMETGSFAISAGQARNHEEELSRFRQLCHQLVSSLKSFWMEIKMHGMSAASLKELTGLPDRIHTLEQQYTILSKEFEDSKQLQALYKMFQERIVHKESYSSNDKVVVPRVPPFVISREDRIVKFNREFCETYDWSQQDLLNESTHKLMPKCFHDYHTQWVHDYIEAHDIHDSKGKSGVKPVKCREGSFIVAQTSVQILPRFEQGIQLLTFMVPEERKQPNSFHMLLDMAARRVLACDTNFGGLLKLEQHSVRAQNVLQEIKLSDMLPIFNDGEARMLEEMRLNTNSKTVQTRFSVRPIFDFLKLPPTCETYLEVEVQYVSMSKREEVKNLRLLKVDLKELAQNCVEQQSNFVKQSPQESSFNQPTTQTQRYGYRLAWWLLCGPSAICLLFWLQLGSLAELSTIVGRQYSLLSLFLEQCTDVVRRIMAEVVLETPKISLLYHGWLEFGRNSSPIMNIVSNLLRGQSSPQDYATFLSVMGARPVDAEQTHYEVILTNYEDYRAILFRTTIGLLVVFVGCVLIDAALNMRYIFGIDSKVDTIADILALITEREIDTILMELFMIEQAFSGSALVSTPAGYSECIDDECQSRIQSPVNFQDGDSSLHQSKIGIRNNRVSTGAMSIVLHAITVKKKMEEESASSFKANSHCNSSDTPNLLLSCNASMMRQPQADLPRQQRQEQPANHAVSRYSSLLPSVGWLVLSSFLLICGIIGQFFVMRSADASVSYAVGFHKVLTESYPILQQETLLVYARIPTPFESIIDMRLEESNALTLRLASEFTQFSLLWKTTLQQDICKGIFDGSEECGTAANGVFKLGQRIVLSTFVLQLRSFVTSGKSAPSSPNYPLIEAILKREQTVYNRLTSTFTIDFGRFVRRWLTYNNVAVGIGLALCLLYLLATRTILEGARNRIARSKQMLEIVPGSILTSNERIAKTMTSAF